MEVIKQIKKQVSLEERAHRVVEKLVEITPSEQYLREVLPCITCSQYSDIVVERAITKLCGYPLCSNTLTAVLNQKYHISLKNKTVYDISDRKNFCSNKCYSASKHLEKQVPSELVWLREGSQRELIKFLAEEDNKGCAGTMVLSGQRHQVVDEGQVVEILNSLLLDNDDDDSDSSGDTSEDLADDSQPPFTTHTEHSDTPEDITREYRLPAAVNICHAQSVTSGSVVKGEKPLTQDMPSTDTRPSRKVIRWNSSNQFQRGLFKSCVIDVSRPVPSLTELRQSSATDQSSPIDLGNISATTDDHKTSTSHKLYEVTAASQTTLERVKTCCYEWKTAELVAFLQYSCSEHLNTGVGLQLNTNTDVSCAEDVNAVTRENSSGKQGEHEKLYERRVGEFYGIKPRVHFADLCKQEAENDDKEIVLASVHSCSQNSLRRKIVLDKLSHVVPRLLESTSLRLSDVSTALRDLIHCLRLTSHNITLKSTEWSIVGYVMLRLLSVRDDTVHSALTSEAAVKTIDKMLSSATVTVSDIDEIVCELQSPLAEGASSDVTECIQD